MQVLMLVLCATGCAAVLVLCAVAIAGVIVCSIISAFGCADFDVAYGLQECCTMDFGLCVPSDCCGHV